MVYVKPQGANSLVHCNGGAEVDLLDGQHYTKVSAAEVVEFFKEFDALTEEGKQHILGLCRALRFAQNSEK